MHRRLLSLGLVTMMLASCSTSKTDPAKVPGTTAAPSAPEVAATPQARSAPFFAPAQTSEAFRKQVAQRIVDASSEVFEDPVPKMLKSIVVVDITLESDGKLKTVTIRRSNGFKALETSALNSVKKAGPFSAPPRSMRRSDGSVNFLETFLFRDDGRFQVRTLAGIQ